MLTLTAAAPVGTALLATFRQSFRMYKALSNGDLSRRLLSVVIRSEVYTMLAAVQRQVAHYAYHTGRLVQLAKIIRGASLQSLSVPRG